MPQIRFSDGLEAILERDTRYEREAYFFLRDALDFTMRKLRRAQGGELRHVTPQELLDGVREHAIREFGPAVTLVLQHWGITKTDDFGHMVFNLVDEGIFGVTENDHLEDFCGYFDFDSAFNQPYRHGGDPLEDLFGDEEEPLR
jgi:uncharacterized repeat protein (TIGR04138 family)